MATSKSPPQPDFITFLFSDVPEFDCHFIVGNENAVKPERIGAVKMMLIAHSVVFRSELEDSKLKEMKDIKIKDIYPDIFRKLLKFIYGHDITGDLKFNEADNLFYVAEKYLMSNLKNKLAMRLIKLLTPANVCSLLNNPAISTQLQLKSAITQILRYETDKVLASPLFPEVCAEGFITILEQDGLAVPEVELWRAAMQWAKHQADSEDEEVMRRQLSRVSKHLRICTLTGDQFCQDVAPTGVLNANESQLVAKSIGTKRKYQELTEFNNELEPRKRLHKRVRLVRQRPSTLFGDKELKLINHVEKESFYSLVTFTIVTKQHAVELLPLRLLADERDRLEPEGWTYTFSCRIKITEVTRGDSSDDSLLKIYFSKEVEDGKVFEVPLAVDGFNVTLPPNSKYTISLFPKDGWYTGYKRKFSSIYENSDMLVSVPFQNEEGNSLSPINCLRYRLADDN